MKSSRKAAEIEREYEAIELPLEPSWEKSLENLHKVLKEDSFGNFAFVYEHEVKADGAHYLRFRTLFGTRDEMWEAEEAIVIKQTHALLQRLFRLIVPSP
jgi:hypothetical protein